MTYRSLSLISYGLLFVAIWGYVAYPNGLVSPDNGSGRDFVFVYIVLALAGAILAQIKNRRIADRDLRLRVTLRELVGVGVIVLLALLLPSSLGGLKLTIVFVAFVAYVFLYLTWIRRLALA